MKVQKKPSFMYNIPENLSALDAFGVFKKERAGFLLKNG